MPVIEIKDVFRRFGNVTALKDISFEISEGEFFSILGPSGCGKTTLLRILSGLDFPDEGSVKICGKDVTFTSAFNRPTNLVFQNLALFPHMTVNQNIAFGLKVKKMNKAEIQSRVKYALKLVALEGYGERRPSQLSGGQQQRVAIARALVNQPKVLLLDEPLGSLDLKLRLQLQVELKDLQRRSGTTFVYVTHDQGEAMTMSDRIAVMKDGFVHQIGSPFDIYSKPNNSFIASFIGDTNLIKGRLITNNNFDCNGDSESLIKLESGMTISALQTDILNNTPVLLSIRQELVQVSANPLNTHNCFLAEIVNVCFVGSIIEYTVKHGQDYFTANVTNSYKDQMYKVGDDVYIGWKRSDVIVLLD